jgi:hypothetical protein
MLTVGTLPQWHHGLGPQRAGEVVGGLSITVDE